MYRAGSGASVVRVATYNIWNSRERRTSRFEAVMDELVSLDADVVALQEVPTSVVGAEPVVETFRSLTQYRHARHFEFPLVEPGERPEGLAILSKFKVVHASTSWDSVGEMSNSWGARVELVTNAGPIGIVNIHLDWEHPDRHGLDLAEIVNRLLPTRRCELEILCGDFNDTPPPGVQELDLSEYQADLSYSSLDRHDDPRVEG